LWYIANQDTANVVLTANVCDCVDIEDQVPVGYLADGEWLWDSDSGHLDCLMSMSPHMD
jgi:hypothetical protein